MNRGDDERRRVLARERQRRLRLRKRVTVLPDLPVTPEPGESVADAVATELAWIRPSPGRSGLAASAMAMARLLDDRSAQPQHPAAAARLADLLERLRDAASRMPVEDDPVMLLRAEVARRRASS